MSGMLTVTSGSSYCSTTNGGECVTDGAGNYGNGEMCTIRANVEVVLRTISFDAESCCDRLTVNSTRYTGVSGPSGITMSAGSVMTWETDHSVVRAGFIVCAAAVIHSSAPPMSPPMPPWTPQPVAPPTPPSPPPASSPPPFVNEGELRLGTGSLLEIYHVGSWGTVCDDDFGRDDAVVACRQLGLLNPSSWDNLGPGGFSDQEIWIDDLNCNGDEETLTDCGRNRWGNNNCGHTEDIYLFCGDDTPGIISAVLSFLGGVAWWQWQIFIMVGLPGIFVIVYGFILPFIRSLVKCVKQQCVPSTAPPPDSETQLTSLYDAQQSAVVDVPPPYQPSPLQVKTYADVQTDRQTLLQRRNEGVVMNSLLSAGFTHGQIQDAMRNKHGDINGAAETLFDTLHGSGQGSGQMVEAVVAQPFSYGNGGDAGAIVVQAVVVEAQPIPMGQAVVAQAVVVQAVNI